MAREQGPWQPGCSSVRAHGARAVRHIRRLILAPLLRGPRFFGPLPDLLVFLSGESLLGWRACSNMRSLSAARPPGGSGVVSPGRLIISRSVKMTARHRRLYLSQRAYATRTIIDCSYRGRPMPPWRAYWANHDCDPPLGQKWASGRTTLRKRHVVETSSESPMRGSRRRWGHAQRDGSRRNTDPLVLLFEPGSQPRSDEFSLLPRDGSISRPTFRHETILRSGR
jgi:hypothetical protein